jgi:uncharacterized protein
VPVRLSSKGRLFSGTFITLNHAVIPENAAFAVACWLLRGEMRADMIALLTLELRIEHAQSLKDKRQVVRSLKDRLRANFNVATAELDSSGLWNRATIGVVSVSDSRGYLDGLMTKVERIAMRIANNAGAEVADSFLEFL